jgi:E3 ubiquitin-protein ligase RNF115/126
VTLIEEEPPAPVGLSKEALEGLPRVEAVPNCSVCQAEDGPGQGLRLPCDHVFHEPCILPWLEKSVRCPSCR